MQIRLSLLVSPTAVNDRWLSYDITEHAPVLIWKYLNHHPLRMIRVAHLKMFSRSVYVGLFEHNQGCSDFLWSSQRGLPYME